MAHRIWRPVLALMVPMYVLLAGVAVLVVHLNTQQREDRVVAEQKAACERRNEMIVAIDDLVTVATTSGSSVDLTGLPSYAALPVDVQTYLSELSAALREAAMEDGATRRALIDYAEGLELEDCTELEGR
jgi:hypothetical protein